MAVLAGAYLCAQDCLVRRDVANCDLLLLTSWNGQHASPCNEDSDVQSHLIFASRLVPFRLFFMSSSMSRFLHMSSCAC